MLRFLFAVILLSFSLAAFTQERPVLFSSVTGKVFSAADVTGIDNLEIAIPQLKLLTATGPEGAFTFNNVRNGNYTLIISDGNGWQDSVKVYVDKPLVDVGILKVNYRQSTATNLDHRNPTIEVEANQSSDDTDGPSDQSISGILTAARDPYVAAAAFTFGSFRYRIRGYSRNQLAVYMNGLQMNDVRTGGIFLVSGAV